MNKMKFNVGGLPIQTIVNQINMVNNGGLDLRPSFQRGYIWNDDFKDKLLYSILNKYPIGSFSLRSLPVENSKGAGIEVVDGQQRLTTIYDFREGNYIIKSEVSRKIIEGIRDEYFIEGNRRFEEVKKICKKLEKKGKIKLKYSDLPPFIQEAFNSYNLAITTIECDGDDSIREYFRFLQNQERLRAGELINSMPASNLETFINEVEDKNIFMDKIGFSDNRAEFDKIFYSLIGLYDLKIPFGTTDRKILAYATKSPIPTAGLEDTERMAKQINAISQLQSTSMENTRKRYLKYLLLLAGFGYVDFSNNTDEKLKKLKVIDDKLSVFFSAKADAESVEYQGCSPEVREELRNIALISKGCHPLARVKNRMEILAYYINNSNDFSRASGITIE